MIVETKLESPRTDVLIVEDERIVARDLQQTLEGMGYGVVGIASSAGEAMQLCVERRPHAVLMDVRIKGGLDGIATAGVLRERFDVPVTFLTAHTDRATLERATKTRPYGYLTKPVNAAELRNAIEVSIFRHAAERQEREANARLAAERDRFAALLAQFQTTLEHVTCGVVVTDVHGSIVQINRRLLQMFDVPIQPEAAVGRNASDLLMGDGARLSDPEDVVARTREITEAGRSVGSDRVDLGDGRRYARDFASARRGAATAGHVWCYYDVTDREREREGLLQQVQLDALTGLPNRRGLEESVQRRLARHDPFAVLFIDLDHFKPINDTLGHDAGDLVLKEVAARMRKAVRADDLVARIAGDEFVVIAGGVVPSAAGRVARKVAGALCFQMPFGEAVAEVSASVGWAMAPGDGQDLATLLRKADAAMYSAKRAQKLSVVHRRAG
jgi:diguanylate cyclase (GGDEF)-like protein